MVMAKKMQDPMDEKPGNSPVEGFARFIRFLPGRIQRDHHIAEHGRFFGEAFLSHGKGQDVRRTILAEVAPVQFRDRVVIGEQDAQLDIM